MDPFEAIKTLIGGNTVYFFIKAFSLVFSTMYFFYSLVMLRQVQVMNKAVSTERKNIFFTLSLAQLIVAFVIILLAIFFI